MPTYDYKCPKCHIIFEKNVKMGQQTAKCEKCGYTSAKKMISAPGGIIFKGSGFYKTDSRAPEKPECKKCPVKKKCKKNK